MACMQGSPWPGGTNPERNDSNPQIYEVIRATNGTYGNVFVGVQAEPDSARYFNFDNLSVQNTVRVSSQCAVCIVFFNWSYVHTKHSHR